MTMTRVHQSAFTTGEVSPRANSRTDLSQYTAGVALMENFRCHPHGGAAKRSGTRFAAETKNSGAATLIPFEYSLEQSYMIEAGSFYLRFFKDGGQITAPVTTAAVTNGLFAANITGWTDLSGAGSSISWNAAQYMNITSNGTTSGKAGQMVTHSSGGVRQVIKFEVIGGPVNFMVGTTSGAADILASFSYDEGYHTTSFVLPSGSAPFYISFEVAPLACTRGVDSVWIISGAPVEITAPWYDYEAADLHYDQSADVIFFATKTYKPMKLTRYGHYSWSLTPYYTTDGPYMTENLTAATLAPSATSGEAITITASAATFSSSDISRLVSIKHSSTWGVARIVGYTSATSVTAKVVKNFGGTTAVTVWKLGDWSWGRGWPQAVSFFEQRLGWAGVTANSEAVVASKTDNFYSFGISDTVVASDAVLYRFVGSRYIQWLARSQFLCVGAINGEFTFSGDSGEALSGISVASVRQSSHGCLRAKPVTIGNRVVFIQRDGRKLRDLNNLTSYDSVTYQAPDLMILAEHITNKYGLTQLTYQQSPDSIVWAVRADGQLVGMTYLPDQKVLGFHRHITGGAYLGGQAVVEKVSTISDAISGENQVWMVVKRTINGVTKRYIEYFAPEFLDEDTDMAFYVDCGLSLDNPLTISSISNAAECVVGVTAHGLVNGDRVRLSRCLGMVEVNRRQYVVSDATTDTFKIKTIDTGAYVDSTGFGIYTHSGQARKCFTVLSGLDHLEGESVSILADGAMAPQQVVTSGSITLQKPAGIVHIGLPFRARLQTLTSEFQAVDGSVQGRIRRIVSIVARVYKTVGLSVGGSFDDLDEALFRQPIMGLPRELFTGDIPVESFAGDPDRVGSICFEHTYPLPATILGVISTVIVGDK